MTRETDRQPATLRARSVVEGVVWPGLPAPPGASLLAVQFQLAQSEWWSAERLREAQREQLRALLTHAVAEVPWYREHTGYREALAAGLDETAFAALPVIDRALVQSAGERMRAVRTPSSHGKIYGSRTTGSTGRPLDTRSTDLAAFFNCALVLRDHLWQRRDLGGKLAVIRGRVEQTRQPGWLPGTGEALLTGPMVLLDIRESQDRQLEWLQREDPHYLLSPASNLHALASRCAREGLRLPRLRAARIYGEMPSADLSELVCQAWGVPVQDVYSAEETGTLALSCPGGDGLHLQEECVRVEVLDDDDRPCAPGRVGRVVVSTLHNFAMPLLRYAIGDHAEAGGPCDCGRGLGMVRRVMGRTRNMMQLPDGDQRWPRLPGRLWQPREVVRQLQVAQVAPGALEVRLVCTRPLNETETATLLDGLRETLDWRHDIGIVYRDELAVGADRKFEDFVNEIPVAARRAGSST